MRKHRAPRLPYFHTSTLPYLATAALLLTAPARADDAGATAAAALKALAAQEAGATAGKLAVTITDRHADFRKDEKPKETRKRVAGEPARRAEGSVRYGRDGWRKDYTVKLDGPMPRTVATHTCQTGGEIRMLVEVSTAGGKEPAVERQGRISKAGVTAPGDAILGHSVARALDGMTWSAAKPEGDLLTLEGQRGEERHTLVLAGSPRMVKSWNLTRRLTAPSGEQVRQDYWCDVTPGETPGSVKKVEEWVITPPPGAGISYRATEVLSSEAAPPEKSIPPDKSNPLRIRFPKGTQVTDARGEVPVKYEETEQGVSDDEIAFRAGAREQGRVKVGERAGRFELPDLKGKPVRLDDFGRKTLLLFWFSSRSAASAAAAPFIGKLSDEYVKRDLQVIGLDVAEQDDGTAPAEAFSKRFEWSFPILLDRLGEGMLRFGAETGVPKVAVIDRNGTLVYVRVGLDQEGLTSLLDRIVQQK